MATRINLKHESNCWLEHHECAIAEVRRLRAVLAKQEFRVSKNHPDTSRAIAPKVREGTLQSEVWALFQHPGVGYTDYELEQATARSHQSVSATRNTLYRKGLIKATGERRQNAYGNDCIVWVAA